MTEPIQHGGWSLVQHGSWEVSIGPDGLIMLPRHLDPAEVPDFIEAITRAAQVGADKQEANAAAGEAPTPEPTPTIVIAPAGDPAHAGAIPLPVTGGVNQPAPETVDVPPLDAPIEEVGPPTA